MCVDLHVCSRQEEKSALPSPNNDFFLFFYVVLSWKKLQTEEKLTKTKQTRMFVCLGEIHVIEDKKQINMRQRVCVSVRVAMTRNVQSRERFYANH